MKCMICQKESNDRYCSTCKHIRNVYVIHKLLEKVALNEKINTSTLITRNIKNIEEYDLELLTDNNILQKDRYNNYKFTTRDDINTYLEKYDRTGKKLKIKDSKKTKKNNIKLPSIDEVIAVIEKNYNITDTLDNESLSKHLNLNKQDIKRIMEKLDNEKLIQKSFYGNYRINYHQIIKYKKQHNITEDKIKTLNSIKKPTDKKDSVIKKDKKTSKKANKKHKQKKTKKTSKQEEIRINTKEAKTESDIIPQLRKYINEKLIILPRNVRKENITLDELYNEFISDTNITIKEEIFKKYFHKTINTYPHTRHTEYENSTRYNIKLRKTPLLTLEKLQENSQKLGYREDTIVEIRDNTLHVNTRIDENEISILYNLIVYSFENIIEYKYKKQADVIEADIIYDIKDEDSDLWLKFLKSYNIG